MYFKSTIFLIVCLCSKLCVIAQQTVSEPTISKITAAEYFIDKDPGAGMGISLNIGASDTLVSFTDSASISGLPTGYHTICIRVRNAQKKWSIFQTKTFYLGGSNTIEPTISKINAAEYFFDKDPGVGNGIALQIGTSDTLVSFADSVVVPSSLSGKDHSIALRVRNSTGKWGIIEIKNFSFAPNDNDRDGLVDYDEPKYGADYRSFDTNGDGLADGVNVLVGLVPSGTDTDGDGISNAQEILRGTSPILQDTDGDGVPDKKDAFPLDRYRTKIPPKNLSDHTAPVITLNEPPL